MTNDLKPLFGETTDSSKAFPGIKDFRVTVTEDPSGYYKSDPLLRQSIYTKSTARRMHPCANPHCKQGGFDIQKLVMFSPPGTYNWSCEGHEGSPKGRRRGDPCDNLFNIILEIERE